MYRSSSVRARIQISARRFRICVYNVSARKYHGNCASHSHILMVCCAPRFSCVINVLCSFLCQAFFTLLLYFRLLRLFLFCLTLVHPSFYFLFAYFDVLLSVFCCTNMFWRSEISEFPFLRGLLHFCFHFCTKLPTNDEHIW